MSNNRTLGAMALLMAILLASFGWGLTAPFAYEPVGPRAFPLLTSALIGICGLILLVQGGGEAERLTTTTVAGIALLILALLAYALLFEPLGYVLSTIGMSMVVARIFGATWVQAAITGVLLSLGSYFLFDRGLDVVLPNGILGGLF